MIKLAQLLKIISSYGGSAGVNYMSGCHSKSLDFCANVIFHGGENLVKFMILVDFRFVLEFLSVVWALELGISS